jgi:hypothetical protein
MYQGERNEFKMKHDIGNLGTIYVKWKYEGIGPEKQISNQPFPKTYDLFQYSLSFVILDLFLDV